MSGHSKWNNIKNKKEKTDAQKAKVFTKIGKEIAIAVREGGGNPDTNRKLKDGDDWSLIDFERIVVHLMSSDARTFYDLEKLWHAGEKIELE